MKYLQQSFLLIIVFGLVVLASRLLYIHSIPPLISHDEIYYPTEARAIAVAGTDTSGTWRPWYLRPAHPIYAELPGTLMVPAALLFQHDPILAAKATHIFLGSLLVIIIAGIAQQLFQEHLSPTNTRRLTIITAILAALNPWLFQFSRMAFDSLFSLFFYCLGSYVFLKLKDKGKLWSLPFLVLGFFQYQALKVLLLPISLGLVAYDWSAVWGHPSKTKKGNLWQQLPTTNKWLLVLPLMSLLILVFYIVRLPSQSAGSRVGDLLFFDSQFQSKQVGVERQVALDSPFTKVFSNKATVVGKELLVKYFGVFHPNWLFTNGETARNSWSVWSWGMFYPIDALLIVIGLATLISQAKLRRPACFVGGWILLAPLPAILVNGENWTMFRACLLIPVLIIVAALGAHQIWTVGQSYARPLLRLLFVFFYVACISFFVHDYFVRYPVYSTKDKYFSERIFSSYLKRIGPEKKVLVLADETRFFYETVLFYNQWITLQNMPAINQAMQTNQHQLSNLRIKTSCLNPADFADYDVVVADRVTTLCPNQQLPVEQKNQAVTLPSLIDSGTMLTLYGDSFCSQFPLRSYSSIRHNVFAIEKLSDQEFCQNFFIRY